MINDCKKWLDNPKKLTVQQFREEPHYDHLSDEEIEEIIAKLELLAEITLKHLLGI